MTVTTENLLLACAALAALLLVLVGICLWRLADHKGNARRRDLEIQALEVERAGTQQRLQDREDIIEHLRRDHQQELDQIKNEFRAQGERFEQQRAILQQDFSRAGQEIAQLKTERRERESRHEEQLQLLNEARENLRKEFENLANRIFEDKGKSFTATSRASLEDLLQPFREQITGFQQRINEVHSEALKGNTTLEAEIRKVLEIGLEMNTQASNLSSALKGDKKTTGNWGEAQLERTLELAGLQKDEHYRTQASFRDEEGKRKLPDFLILLPDDKSLVVDSKVSLVDYDRAVAADTEEARNEALAAHVQAVRRHIDDLNIKDYANLPDIGSPDFVLMFMPVEPAYIEAMKHNRELFDYGYRKNVIMVSHTTLMPILRTVANLWMIDKSNREAREISSRAGDIYNQVCRVAERLEKLGNTMRTAQGHYNDTVTSLVGKQGLIGKVDRFQQVSTKANKTMPALEPIQDDVDSSRLSSAREESADPGPAPSLENDAGDSKVRALKTDG
jgi:DNA recombination protein RmuC